MKKIFFYPATLLASLILNIFWDNYFSIDGISPQLTLLVLIYLSLREGPLIGEVWGFFAGLSLDVFSSGPFGSQGLFFTVIGFATGMLKGKMEEDNYLAIALLVVLVSWLSLISFNVVQNIFSTLSVRSINWIYWIAIPIYNIILAPVIYLVLGKWQDLWQSSRNSKL